MSRRSRMYASPKPTQAAPSVVVATATVSDWRVSEMPLSTNAKAIVVRNPPTIQMVPPSCAPSRTTSRRAKRGPAPRATRRPRPGSGSRKDSSTAEAAASLRVGGEGLLELFVPEVRPERVGEDELGVGQLPQQEVRDPQLA